MNLSDSDIEIRVNDLKKVLDELNHERELYTDLSNALPAGIYRLRVFRDLSLIDENWETSKDTPYKLEFANNRFFEILHLDKELFIKNPGIISDFIFEEDKDSFVKLNVEANLNKTPFTWEGRFKINEDQIWIHFESVPRLLENGDIIWTGTLNDVSKRKSAELEIASKNRELEKLNAEKNKFFSIIAHDLRSPFNAIIGLSELLVEEIDEKNYENAQEYSAIILQSAQRAMALLKNLMEWAQLKTGKIEYNPEHFNAVDLVKETTLLYREIAKKKSINLEETLPHFLSIYADKAMISSILRNFISNAIKFTKPGGNVVVSVEEKSSEILFSVKDTGVGISRERIVDIFKIDHMYSTTGTDNEKGTGMGLSLCKDFVDRHSGKIWVESEENTGSVFYFSLKPELDLK